MNIQKMYAEKLKTATDAVKTVKSGDTVDYGFGATHPVALDKALAARADNLKDITVRGGVALFQPEISKIPAEQNPFIWHDWHMSKATRNLTKAGLAYYIPLRYSEMPRYYRENLDPVNVAMLQVSPMDKHGYFNFGPTASHLGAICDSAKTIIVEINQNFPRCLGGTETGVHISKVDIIVEGDNQALAQLASAPITELDKAVGRFIVEQIPSGACLQLGIGGMPNAVGSLLVDSDVKDLGVHTEMYVDAFVDLSMAGKITGAYKSRDRYRQTFTFGAGTQKLYDFVNDNPEVLAAPVDYVNDIRVISSIDNMISINNVIEVDLFGQINAETSGFRHISGAGGQLDYVLGTYLSKGGKSFICCSSTFKDKTGNLKSRIVPTMAPGGIVTDTRCNVQYLVTEYGIVNLKGKSTWQRAEAIISIAHPDFRDELIAKAEQMHIWKATNKR